MGRIVWIASYPKSGNTWTRAFLHNLFRDASKPFDINDMDLLSANEAAIVYYQALDRRPWQEWTLEEVAAMRPRAQAAIAALRPHTIFCKTHLAVMTVRGRPTINMDVTAGAIYLVRNPLDVVLSFADHQGLSIDKTIDLMNLRNYETPNTETLVGEPMGNWSQHVESWTARPHPGLHVLRYEDLLQSPQRGFAGLAKYLKIDAPRQRIERAVKNSSFKVLRHQEELKGFKEKTRVQKHFFRAGRAGQWREALSPEQVERLVSCHREQMARFGYLPDGM